MGECWRSKSLIHKMENAEEDVEALKQLWAAEQNEFKTQIVETDSSNMNIDCEYIGGLDISFIIGDDVNACACYVIINSNFEVVHKDLQMVQMTAPYVPGFLAFREANFLVDLVQRQMNTKPEVTPGVLLVDGNGILHPRQCGLACHIGVSTGLPTVGVAKNLHQIQEFGEEFTRESVKKRFSRLTETEHYITLSSLDGKALGAALRTNPSSDNPVYVSVGSGLCLETAVQLVNRVSRYRIPEPTRQADILSREFLRIHHPTEKQKQPKKKDVKSHKDLK